MRNLIQLTAAGAPSGWMELEDIGTRPHPGGGVPPDRRRAFWAISFDNPGAAEAGGQGETSPLINLIFYLFFLLCQFFYLDFKLLEYLAVRIMPPPLDDPPLRLLEILHGHIDVHQVGVRLGNVMLLLD